VAEVIVLDRYVSAEMEAVFSDQARFEYWRQVELAALVGYAHVGLFEPQIVTAAQAFPCPSVDAVKARERTTRHDVVAFVTEWTAPMPAAVSSRVHRGLTSSDIVDTGWALALRDATALIVSSLDDLVAVLARHAITHSETIRIGRTHGQHATVDSWGHRVADFALAADRARERLKTAGRSVLVAKLSGTTGTYQQVPVAVESYAAATLGLRPAEVATQVVMRDRMAEWMFALAAIASVCEAIGLEIRLGQRSEVAEFAEGGRTSQAGSSSMPHKKNPITAERICGLARMVRAYVNPVLEGVALWHERDLTHSSVERVAVPDAAALTEYVTRQTASVMSTLVVDADRMRSRAESAVVPSLSNAVLVTLADGGLSWADSWRVVERATKGVGQSATPDEFVASVTDALMTECPDATVVWDPATAMRVPGSDLDGVFERVAELLDRRS
jgi:adenylosuccinate lyase